MYKSIFLIGFRATGKTTIGKALAKKLGWQFIDTDDLIIEKSGSSINTLTNNGTSWVNFRQLEHNVIMEILHKHDIVVGVGGGAPVNKIIQPQSGKTFGELNIELIKKRPEVALILLTADNNIIRDRLFTDEMNEKTTSRPILDEDKAKEVQKLIDIKGTNPAQKKELIIEEIIKDSLKTFEIRKPMYNAQTDKVIDTNVSDPDTLAEEIIQLLS